LQPLIFKPVASLSRPVFSFAGKMRVAAVSRSTEERGVVRPAISSNPAIHA
jgi:hypothetical protein